MSAYEEILVVASWSGAVFAVGVGWSCYRAVGWVERMRGWAMAVPLCDQELDEKGTE